MTHFRSLVLAAAMAAVTLPALAQTAAPDTAPAPSTDSAAPNAAVPDTGVKKAPATARTHHHVRHVHAHTAPTAAPLAN